MTPKGCLWQARVFLQEQGGTLPPFVGKQRDERLVWVDAALCRWVAFRFSQDEERSFILYKLGLFACFFLNTVCLGSEPLTISRAFALSISQGSVCVYGCGGGVNGCGGE